MGERRDWLRWLVAAYVVTASVMAVIVLLAYRQGELDGALQDVYNTSGSRLTGLLSIGDFMLWSASIAVAGFAASLVTGQGSRVAGARRMLLAAAAITVVFLIDDVLALHELFGRTIGQAIGHEDQRGLLEAIPLALEGLLLLAFVWLSRGSTEVLRVRPLLLLVVVWLGLSVAVDLIPESLFVRLVPGGDDGAEGLQTTIEELCKLLGIVTWLAFVVVAGRRAVIGSGGGPSAIAPGHPGPDPRI